MMHFNDGCIHQLLMWYGLILCLYAVTLFAFITKIANGSHINNNLVTEMLLPLVARKELDLPKHFIVGIGSLREDLERKMAVITM